MARGIDVSLNFDQRNGRFRHRPVGVKDGIRAVLPTLIDEARTRRTGIVDKSIAVRIGYPVYPRHGGLECRPQPIDECKVARALHVGASEQYIQRRRVDAAVIATKRHFPRRCHLASPCLVHDLSGGGVVERGRLAGLVLCQELQHAAGE